MGSVFEDAHQHYPPLSLEEIQQRYSTLAEAIPEILFSNSPDGSCDYVSGQFEAYTGIPKKQALGFGWTAAIHPEDTERVQREWAEVVRTGEPCDIEFRLRASEGAYRWFRARTKPLRDAAGNITEWFGVCMDVDARKRAEEQLRRAHVKLRAIVQSAPLAICAIDLSGRVTIWNPAAERMFGWTQEEVMGGFLPVIMESQDFFALLERARHGEVLHGWEERRSRKDGSVIDISISLASLRDIDGFLILVEEITERKKYEEHFREMQRLEGIGILAGGMAHDFNNLLTGILGNATLALEAIAPESPAREHLEDVIGSGNRAAELTAQLLAYAGKGRLVKRPADLSGLVTEIGHLIRSAIPRHIQLCLELASDLPAVAADSGQIQQVIMNLVSNAAEALGDQEGTITVSTGAQETEGRPGKFTYLEVRDTGPGMSQEIQAKIFDPFFTTKFMGRGLGLAAVSGIVRSHQGTIEVYSSPGEGSAFRVVLPASPTGR